MEIYGGAASNANTRAATRTATFVYRHCISLARYRPYNDFVSRRFSLRHVGSTRSCVPTCTHYWTATSIVPNEIPSMCIRSTRDAPARTRTHALNTKGRRTLERYDRLPRRRRDPHSRRCRRSRHWNRARRRLGAGRRPAQCHGAPLCTINNDPPLAAVKYDRAAPPLSPVNRRLANKYSLDENRGRTVLLLN